MVVNRRVSVSTAPQISRTSSTQPVSRVPKASTPQASTLSHTVIADKPTKTISTSPQKRSTKKSSFFPGPLQFLLALSFAFTVYTATWCRNDFGTLSPVCQSIYDYRTKLVDPYIRPSFERLAQHSEPYIEPIKQYAEATTTFARIHVLPRASAFLDTSITQYHNEVAPRLHWLVVDQVWNRFAKPLYFDILHPHVERHTRPHRYYYHKFLLPQAQKCATHAHAMYIRALPRARYNMARARRNAVAIYEFVRAHALVVYERILPHAVSILHRVRMQALILTHEMGKVRSKFVDPHLGKILDKFGENGGSQPTSSSDT